VVENMKKIIGWLPKKNSGQTMTEYIVIVVVVALAALAIFGIFSDTLRQKLAGTVSTFDSGQNAQNAQQAVQTSSQDVLKNLQSTGISTTTGS
jgi:Flp pilus assembly pilin Flp